ncbi:helix-turn-helix domain-containing protein [Paenibacillus tritici]|nr:helix-turn-helix domain-containing protein [Paenibacillus tritici]
MYLSLQEAYPLLFQSYPDVVDITQMCEMLGGISFKTGYKLLKENKIEHFKIGRSYKIPKINIMIYLHLSNIQPPLNFNALPH